LLFWARKHHQNNNNKKLNIIRKLKRVGVIAQEVECPPSKREALKSNHMPPKRKRKKGRKGGRKKGREKREGREGEREKERKEGEKENKFEKI
jgi:hypothetical protein